MNDRESAAPLRKSAAAALSAAVLLNSLTAALPAWAQVEVAPRAVLPGAPASAVRPVPAAMGNLQGLPVLSAPIAAPSALSPSAVAAAPSAGLGASAAPSAAAASRAASAVAPLPAAADAQGPSAQAASPAGAPSAAAPAAAASIPGTPAGIARAFGSFLKGLSAVHPALDAGRFFDGASERAGDAAENVRAYAALPRTKGMALRRPRATLRAEDVVQGTPLDADPKDMDSVEKALRAVVDANPGKYGAPSSQLAKVSVNLLPSIQDGQGASIIAVFRQALTGDDKDGTPYQLAVAGKSLTFHIKVFKDGKPVVMGESGELAPGVSADVMNVAFDDDQLTAIAAKRSKSAPDRALSSGGKMKLSSLLWTSAFAARGGKAAARSKARPKRRPAPRSKPHPRTGKTKPRGGSEDEAEAGAVEEPVPAAPKFLTRQLTDEIGGKWRAINIYQASDPKGEPLIVIVDVKSGEAFAISAKSFRAEEARHRLISGSASGRAVLPDENGGDHGPIGPIALPLTNVYDESGKVVAVTDEQGNFSIPDDGSGKPVKLTIRLASPLVPFVRDENAQKNGPVEVTVTATPGQKLSVMLNPVSADPEVAANIVGYVGYLRHHIWVKGLPGMDGRMDVPLTGGIVVNGHEEQGNAFYDPSTDSVNLMAAAVITVRDSKGRKVKLTVENTAVWSIEDHEDTHRVVQTYSQIQLTPKQKESPVYRFVKWSMDTIMGSDVNESIADVVSYFMRKASTIGDGFYGNLPPGKPDFIRSALEKTQYDPKDPDPHNGVLAQAMWTVRQAFIDKLGQAAGEAYANAMIPLILISQPLNPVDALLHMILWDMREDGTSPFGELIRRIAKSDHGIDLPPTRSAPVPSV